MKKTFILAHDIARRGAMEYVRQAPDGFMVTIKPPVKSREMEEKYHAQIGDIAEQYLFCGRKWDAEDMKRLLIDQFRRDTIKDPELAPYWAAMGVVDMAPSLDGAGVVALGVQSRRFPKPLGSAFIEWLNAFGDEHEVQWSEPKRRAA